MLKFEVFLFIFYYIILYFTVWVAKPKEDSTVKETDTMEQKTLQCNIITP